MLSRGEFDQLSTEISLIVARQHTAATASIS
jgi:hypothetical protein